MVKADSIIFDLDGTLWDSTKPAAVIWREVAQENPCITDEVTKERLKEFYGLPLEDIARGLFQSVPPAEAIRTMEECVVRQCPYLVEQGGTLLGPVEKTLKQLKDKGLKLFIVSNCRSGYIEAFFEAHKLGKYFDDFLCPGDTGKLKADNIKMIVERWQLQAPVYVGDTQGDCDAAGEAGVPFIFAGYGFGRCKHYVAKLETIEDLQHYLR